MEGGIAIPHPRRPLPYAIAEPILVVALNPQGIGFSAPDGRLTDLFFMTASQDDHHHLHILARLCRMLRDGGLANKLRETTTTEQMTAIMRQSELDVISQPM